MPPSEPQERLRAALDEMGCLVREERLEWMGQPFPVRVHPLAPEDCIGVQAPDGTVRWFLPVGEGVVEVQRWSP